MGTLYDLQLPEVEIDAYYTLKERFQQQHAPPEAAEGDADATEDGDVAALWVQNLSPDERGILQKALMRRLVCCIDKLDQVQRDKPGNWKLWRGKLVSERYWGSLCEAERLVGEEIDSCISEAEELEPG